MGRSRYALLVMLAALLICTCLMVISCGTAGAGTEEEDTGQKQQESSISPEELEEIQKAIEEEEADATDYGSVTAGAELYGYMPSYLCTDTDNYVKVEVTNTSDFTWRASGENRVRLGYHYYGQDVDFGEYDRTARTPLPDNLEPGETAVVEVLINDIENPGTYVVQIDLVLEGHWWFGDSNHNNPMIEGRVYFNSCLEDRDQ